MRFVNFVHQRGMRSITQSQHLSSFCLSNTFQRHLSFVFHINAADGPTLFATQPMVIYLLYNLYTCDKICVKDDSKSVLELQREKNTRTVQHTKNSTPSLKIQCIIITTTIIGLYITTFQPLAARTDDLYPISYYLNFKLPREHIYRS